MRGALAVTLALVVPILGGARRLGQRGEKAFREGKLPEAEKAFGQAASRDPKDPVWNYDLGSVRAARSKEEEARRNLRAAAAGGDRGIAASALYQLGTMDLSGERYPDAVKNFRRALEIDPNKSDAKRNLEIALRKAATPPQQQQQQQSNGGNDQKKQTPSSSEADREFQNKAGMSREEAEAMLRSLDAEQRRRERVAPAVHGKDW